jgi:hypothetical protein
MLRGGASEIFGASSNLPLLYFMEVFKGPKRTLPREANVCIPDMAEVDGMGRLFGRCGDTCAYRRSLLLFPRKHRYHSLKGPKVRSRSKYEEALSDLGRMAPGARSRLAPPIRDWLRRLALQNRAPRGGYHTRYGRTGARDLQTSRGRADTDFEFRLQHEFSLF